MEVTNASKVEGDMRQAMVAISAAVQAMEPEVSAKAAAGAMIRLAAFMLAAQNVPPEEFLRLCRTQSADAEAHESGRRPPADRRLH